MKCLKQYTCITQAKQAKVQWTRSVEYIMNKAFYSLELIINFTADPKINFPYPV